jgi:hypothetical protein
VPERMRQSEFRVGIILCAAIRPAAHGASREHQEDREPGASRVVISRGSLSPIFPDLSIRGAALTADMGLASVRQASMLD